MTAIRIEATKNILSGKRFTIGVLKKTTTAKETLYCFFSNTPIRC